VAAPDRDHKLCPLRHILISVSGIAQWLILG
jgi:hypothetical protein